MTFFVSLGTSQATTTQPIPTDLGLPEIPSQVPLSKELANLAIPEL